ncbi:hypothetical protein IQ264_12890 [Phormidium sp. LEGE 05292]|uniref:hypothetical protein n=1 Tax=[Phormidium] sp. LEGE 05292 TaxID=767427 RepID=UPI001882CFAB|nr:hypothetical protein [Phormidium sp. LEGE 05292]MBE9226320.1 hypothetical protein [Phormidium sp. LEGE 05292]
MSHKHSDFCFGKLGLYAWDAIDNGAIGRSFPQATTMSKLVQPTGAGHTFGVACVLRDRI